MDASVFLALSAFGEITVEALVKDDPQLLAEFRSLMLLASPLGPFRRFNLAHPKLLILR
jgi:hypothetical protein